MRKRYDFTVQTLGECKIPSPVQLSKSDSDNIANYVQDDEHILYDINVDLDDSARNREYGIIQKAGPREKIYFNPRHVHAGILTCGGLCPGLNDVIRALVRAL